MKNIEISIDESLLAAIHKANGKSGRELSRVIEEALQAWLKRRKAKAFEREWIAALKQHPDDVSRAEAWLES
ncbi:MAG: ribbon-helix-helix protein, CopG family, partial [bacterium]